MKISCENCKNYEPSEYPLVHTFFGKPFDYWLKLEAASHLTDEDAKHLKDKIGEMLLQLSIHSVDKYFEACDNCYDFINSLKETK